MHCSSESEDQFETTIVHKNNEISSLKAELIFLRQALTIAKETISDLNTELSKVLGDLGNDVSLAGPTTKEMNNISVNDKAIKAKKSNHLFSNHYQ